MRVHKNISVKFLSLLFTAIFLFQNTCYGLDLTAQDLGVPLVFQDEAPTPESQAFSDQVLTDYEFRSIVLAIASHFLRNGGKKSDLVEALADEFNTDEAKAHLAACPVRIDLEDDVDGNEYAVKIGFEKDGARALAKITLNGEESDQLFSVEIGPAEDDGSSMDKDLKGRNAADSDTVLQKIIKQGRLVELYLEPDPETGWEGASLKANRIKWVKGYRPGKVDEDLYRTDEIAVRQILSDEEKINLENWLKEHKVRGSPVKFRVVLGDAIIGWSYGKDEDAGFASTAKDALNMSHANVAHAGLRDGAIYMGGLLLKHVMRNDNEELRREILDNDEYRHIKGLDHGSDEDYQKRLQMVKNVLEDGNYNFLLDNNDPYVLRDIISDILKGEDGDKRILDLFAVLNQAYYSQPLYPVEADYLYKKAVTQLVPEEKEQLANILVNASSDYRYMTVVDDILLMLVPSKSVLRKLGDAAKDWVKRVWEAVEYSWIKIHAPNLENRSLWQISPEIWHEAGGLARVMQYHGAGIKDLMGCSGMRFRQIEPHYMNRISPEQEAVPLDYTKKPLTHPIVKIIEVMPVYTVELTGGMKVDVEVTRGINDLGIEVFLVRDKNTRDGAGNIIHGEGYYTHSLYNYRAPWDAVPNFNLPTWEEFSMFYSKASLKLVQIQETKEKNEKESKGLTWEAPILHTNDSQTALVGVYRKIWLDEEMAKKDSDENYKIDPVLEDATVFFTTHTYGNRREYNRRDGSGANLLKYFGIPEKYWELFRYTDEGKDVVDIASGGLRAADAQGCVAKAHRDDISKYDTWINNPWSEELRRYYRDVVGVEMEIKAISNGDHREQTMKYFTRYMREIYGDDVDVEHPAPEQVFETKKKAKENLQLRDSDGVSTKYYSSDEKPEDDMPLRDDQMVVSYSGRLVPEKAGRGGLKGHNGALSDENIEYMVKRGVQVLIYGNVQANNQLSSNLAERLTALAEKLKHVQPEDGFEKGRLIFVPRFTLDQQRALLAASDVQVQDSYPSTEAAGFTEADVSACGGIQVGTLRKDNKGVGEGLFQQQGYPIDPNVPGKGNTYTPKSLTSKGYRDVIMGNAGAGIKGLFEMYSPDLSSNTLMTYQATSVRMSAILEARLTSAAYLRAFSQAVANKAKKENRRRKREEAERMKKKVNDLLEQVHRPDFDKDPEGYTKYEIERFVIDGEIDKAIDVFFTGVSFQMDVERLHAPVIVINDLLKVYGKDHNKSNIKAFLNKVIGTSAELTGNREVSQAIQLIAGQALTVMSWIDREVPGAVHIRLTADTREMARSDKKPGGKSFLDFRTLPVGIRIAYVNNGHRGSWNEENKPGFFWRGVELISKLGDTLQERFTKNAERLDSVRDNLVMYLMDHGFIDVPNGLLAASRSNKISTIHETVFLHDIVPGTIQTTSTGPGHYQGLDLDIKQVTEGKGVQVNVKYDENGEIVETIVHPVTEGMTCYALPGYVDYMINLGGLRFNDYRVTLSMTDDIELINKLSPGLSKEFADDAAVLAHGKAIKDSIKTQPFTGIIDVEGNARLVKDSDLGDDVVLKYISKIEKGFSGIPTLLEFYNRPDITMNDVMGLVKEIADSHDAVIQDMASHDRPLILAEDKVVEETAAEREDAAKNVSMGKTQAVLDYIEDNKEFLPTVFGEVSEKDRLIRISIQSLKSIGIENIKGVLGVLQANPRYYIELYSTESVSDVAKETYTKFGIDKKKLPEGFKYDRTNTITLMPVDKMDKFSTGGRKKREGETSRPGWELGGVKPGKTILSPVGLTFDRAGIVRSLILGLRLQEIAAMEENDPEKLKENEFVKYTLMQYKEFCISQGQDSALFNLFAGDIINLAKGELRDVVTALNKVIRLLPIVPLNAEEIRLIHERAKEAMIRA